MPGVARKWQSAKHQPGRQGGEGAGVFDQGAGMKRAGVVVSWQSIVTAVKALGGDGAGVGESSLGVRFRWFLLGVCFCLFLLPAGPSCPSCRGGCASPHPRQRGGRLLCKAVHVFYLFHNL